MTISFQSFLSTVGLKCNNCMTGYDAEHKPVVIDVCKNTTCKKCMEVYNEVYALAPCPGCKTEHAVKMTYTQDATVSEQVAQAEKLWKSIHGTNAAQQVEPRQATAPAVEVETIPCFPLLSKQDAVLLECYTNQFLKFIEELGLFNDAYIMQRFKDDPKDFFIFRDSVSGEFLGFTTPHFDPSISKCHLHHFYLIHPTSYARCLEAITSHFWNSQKINYFAVRIRNPIEASNALEFVLAYGMKYTLTNDIYPSRGTELHFYPHELMEKNPPLGSFPPGSSHNIVTLEHLNNVRVTAKKNMDSIGLTRLIDLCKQGSEAEALKLQYIRSPADFTLFGIEDNICGFSWTTNTKPLIKVGQIFVEPAFEKYTDQIYARFLSRVVARAEEDGKPWTLAYRIDTPEQESIAAKLKEVAIKKGLDVPENGTKTLFIGK